MGKVRRDRIAHMDEGISSAEHEAFRMFDRRNEVEYLISALGLPLCRTSKSTSRVDRSAVDCNQDISTGGEVGYLHSLFVAVRALSPRFWTTS